MSLEVISQNQVCLSYHKVLRDAPFDIWGGGGLEFLLLANFFFLPPVENKLFFRRSTSDNFFFMFCRRNFLSYAFPIMYVTIWCFSWSTYFSSISTTNFFFCSHFQQTFFSDFRGDKLFFSILDPPPPPRYQMVRPLQDGEHSHRKKDSHNKLTYYRPDDSTKSHQLFDFSEQCLQLFRAFVFITRARNYNKHWGIILFSFTGNTAGAG